jgi:hypothetical protein
MKHNESRTGTIREYKKYKTRYSSPLFRSPTTIHQITLNIFSLTPLFIATGLPFSSSKAAGPPSSDIPANFSFTSSSICTCVFLTTTPAPSSASLSSVGFEPVSCSVGPLTSTVVAETETSAVVVDGRLSAVAFRCVGWVAGGGAVGGDLELLVWDGNGRISIGC